MLTQRLGLQRDETIFFRSAKWLACVAQRLQVSGQADTRTETAGMDASPTHSITRMLEIGFEALMPFFDGFGEGVIIVDRSGTIVYYNPTMTAIDELAAADALGKKVVDIYDLSAEESYIMQCLHTRQPIVNRTLLYRTRWGKIANTLHTVFPLINGGRLAGAICLVREYNLLEETIASVSLPRPQMALPNETQFDFDAIVGSNIDFLRVVNTARMAARTPSPVMLYGETGTGKELFAQAIHNHSENRQGRYTAVNCAAIPENLLEGLLFGTTRGAFSGARDKIGLFERANGGTLFLDELNSMTIRLQAKILRVVQERRVRRLGSLQEKPIDFKLISSVNTEPHVAIAENSLRPDLFYRLGVVFIPIPPLRNRKEDIVLLARHFLTKHSRALNREINDISSDVLALFNRYDWPGNVRELEHVIEGAINLVVSSPTIERRHLQSHMTAWQRLSGQPDMSQMPTQVSASDSSPRNGSDRPSKPASGLLGKEPAGMKGKGLRQIQADHERRVVCDALAESSGNVTRAAQRIGISRQLLNYKMKKHRIDRRHFLT
jgi:arginine utilization regulatory protein